VGSTVVKDEGVRGRDEEVELTDDVEGCVPGPLRPTSGVKPSQLPEAAGARNPLVLERLDAGMVLKAVTRYCSQ
jgi:hypothetical protein